MRIIIKERPEDGRYGLGLGAVALLSPFAKVLVGALLIGLLSSGGFNVVQKFKTMGLENRLLESQNELIRITSELNACQIVVDQHNRDILNIKLDAEEDVALVKDVNKQLDNIAKVQQGEIDRLKLQNAPVSCEEAQAWLRDNIKVYE